MLKGHLSLASCSFWETELAHMHINIESDHCCVVHSGARTECTGHNILAICS